VCTTCTRGVYISGYGCIHIEGEIFETDDSGGAIQVLRAYLPVMKSFGFHTDLRAATGGTAFPQMAFDHWEMVRPVRPVLQGRRRVLPPDTQAQGLQGP
jgi:translation elongation factor EF-G